MEFLKNLFDSEFFMPHGHCYLWRTDILWLNVASDVGIALAYFMIPLFLITLVRKRRDLRFNWIFILFALFIMACGLTHVVEIVTVWNPYYAIQGITKALTAAVSLATAVALYYLVPAAIAFPSIEQLELTRERYRSILDLAMDAFIAVDSQGMITYCNRQLLVLSGWTEAELIGHPFIATFVPKRFQNPRLTDGEFLSSLRQTTLCLLMKNGLELPTDINTAAIQNDDASGFGLFIHNAAERIQAERLQNTQLEVTKALVNSESIPEAFSRFMRTVSHCMDWDFAGLWTDNQFHELWLKQDSPHADFAAQYARQSTLPQAGPDVEILNLNDGPFSYLLRVRIELGGEHAGLFEFFSNDPATITSKTRDVLQDLGNRLALFVKRQQAEDQTRLSEERYRELVDSVKDYGIVLVDPNGLVLSWNRGAEQLSGYKSAEAIGQSITFFYPSEANEGDAVGRELEIARRVGKFEDEGWRRRKDDSRFFANVVITPIFDAQDRLQGFSTITRDITGRKQAEEKQQLLEQELKRQVQEQTEELRHSANQIRTITDALPDAVIYFDRDQNLLFANATYLQWQKKKPTDLDGQSLKDILGTFAQERMQKLFTHNDPEEKLSFEYEFLVQGVARLCHVFCIPDVSDRKLRGVIAVLADITDQRSVEESLRIAKEDADAANAAKSAFLANMSHEIRTPLGAILGYSELLISQGISSSERLNYLGALKRNGELLSNIINDVLDLSKVEAGKLDFERQDVPIHEILTDLTTLLHLQAVEKGINLVVSADGPIPSSIETDSLRLRQILMNIVGNALKFTSKGSIEVRVKSVTDPKGKAMLAFIVKDTGPGISSEQASKLFRPFSQADVSTTRKFGGTGLGLTLSKKLANGLGGDLVLTTSKIGEGSTFTITIDPGQASKVLFESTAATLQRTAPTLVAVESNRIDGLSILLVEDSLDNQIVVHRFLTMAGGTADLADNGAEALEKIKIRTYDVVLMDIQMPVMDGFEAIDALRKMGYDKPVIALTAHALKEQRQQCLDRGFTNHITKPVNRDALIQMIAQYGRRAERA